MEKDVKYSTDFDDTNGRMLTDWDKSKDDILENFYDKVGKLEIIKGRVNLRITKTTKTNRFSKIKDKIRGYRTDLYDRNTSPVTDLEKYETAGGDYAGFHDKNK